jgi:hypothetical protein
MAIDSDFHLLDTWGCCAGICPGGKRDVTTFSVAGEGPGGGGSLACPQSQLPVIGENPDEDGGGDRGRRFYWKSFD